MPGRLFLERSLNDLSLILGGSNNLEEPSRRNISPGENIVVWTKDRQFTRMRWGIIPVGRVNARGRPVMETIINARSESVFDKSAFDGVARAIVPTNGWYEWTGKTRKKKAWRIKPISGDPLFFAAITDVWLAPDGRDLAQVATVTCPPSADVREVHHRMGVLLEVADIETWLDGDEDAARTLMRPFPDGRLRVEPADDVDWSAP